MLLNVVDPSFLMLPNWLAVGYRGGDGVMCVEKK